MPRREGKTLAEYTAKYTRRSWKTRRAAAAIAGADGASHRAHSGDGEAIEKLAERGSLIESDGSVYYRISKFPEYGKLSHNDFTGIRAGARVDVDEYDKAERARFRAMEGAQKRRAFWESEDWPGPARLAYRVLRDGDEVSGRDARHPRGRRRSDLSASRKRDRAVRGRHASLSRASGCTRSF